MKVLSIVLLMIASLSLRAQKVPDTLAAKNGTYLGVYYYKHNQYADTAYLRVTFLNDTTFAFAYMVNEGSKFVFNNAQYPGIGRLISYHGKKIWAAVLDDGRIMNMDKSDALFLDAKHGLSLERFLSGTNLEDEYLECNSYVALQFDFTGNGLQLTILKKRAGRFDTAPVYKKIDNESIAYTAPPGLNYARLTFNGSCEGILKQNAVLHTIPLPDKLPSDKIKATLPAGSEVFLGYPMCEYMNFLFVLVFDHQHQLTNYGWIERQDVKQLKQNR